MTDQGIELSARADKEIWRYPRHRFRTPTVSLAHISTLRAKIRANFRCRTKNSDPWATIGIGQVSKNIGRGFCTTPQQTAGPFLWLPKQGFQTSLGIVDALTAFYNADVES
jgi:hypothetical protein